MAIQMQIYASQNAVNLNFGGVGIYARLVSTYGVVPYVKIVFTADGVEFKKEILRELGTGNAWVESSATYTPSTAGSKNIVVTATPWDYYKNVATGAPVQASMAITVNPEFCPAPQPAFTWGPNLGGGNRDTAGYAPVAVSFRNMSGPTGDCKSVCPTSYLWKFGDSATSTAVHPTHTYTKKGSYRPTLETTSKCGTRSISELINVLAPGEPTTGVFTLPESALTGATYTQTALTGAVSTVFTGQYAPATNVFTGSTPVVQSQYQTPANQDAAVTQASTAAVAQKSTVAASVGEAYLAYSQGKITYQQYQTLYNAITSNQTPAGMIAASGVQSSAKPIFDTSMMLVLGVAGVAVIGGAYILMKRRG